MLQANRIRVEFVIWKLRIKLMKIGKGEEFESIFQAMPGHLMYLYCISLCLFRLQWLNWMPMTDGQADKHTRQWFPLPLPLHCLPHVSPLIAANESIMRHIFAAINIYVEINYFILKWPQYILWSTGNGTGICRKHKYKHRQRRRRRHTGYCTHNAVWSVRVCVSVCNVAYSCWFLRPHSQCNRALIDTVNDMHIMCASVCACVPVCVCTGNGNGKQSCTHVGAASFVLLSAVFACKCFLSLHV